MHERATKFTHTFASVMLPYRATFHWWKLPSSPGRMSILTEGRVPCNRVDA
jgi:hypothetical protein